MGEHTQGEPALPLEQRAQPSALVQLGKQAGSLAWPLYITQGGAASKVAKMLSVPLRTPLQAVSPVVALRTVCLTNSTWKFIPWCAHGAGNGSCHAWGTSGFHYSG